MRYLSVMLSLVILIAAACGGNGDTDAPTEAPDTPEASGVIIAAPQAGTIIYAEMAFISGEVLEAEQTFRVELVDTEDNVIAETTLTESPGIWTAELEHGYDGDPTEITIRAVSEDDAVLDSVSVMLSNMDERPDGSFGTIASPSDGDSIGGDSILVEGSASGLFENEFILALFDDAGESVAETFVLLNNPYFVDDVPWQAELIIGDYTGTGEIRAYYIDAESGDEVTLDSVTVEVEPAAG